MAIPTGLRPLPEGETVMVAAFEGWNDAGSSSSAALDHLSRVWGAKEFATLDSEEFHDFQVNRPTISRNHSGERVISWPGTVLARATDGVGRPVLLARGIEPSARWREFCAEILDHAENMDVRTLITCGAVLVDAPHTRPLPIYVTSEDAAARGTHGIERSDYDGPVGITGVLAHEATLRGITVLSVWVGVPHYIAHPPSPKATLALLQTLERFTGAPIDLGDLEYEAEAWQRGADDLANEDDEIADHVRSLEEVTDAAHAPEASGDAIAAEFEQFLKRRDPGM